MRLETVYGAITRRADAREAYPDRWKRAQERGVVLDIYVPTAEANTNIKRGSGIVGSPSSLPGNIVVHYEGGLFDPTINYDEKVRIAASRHITVYPTVAMSTLPASWLTKVGEYDSVTNEITITDPDSLAAWEKQANEEAIDGED